jgi:hypothetical protein
MWRCLLRGNDVIVGGYEKMSKRWQMKEADGEGEGVLIYIEIGFILLLSRGHFNKDKLS